MMNGDLKEIIRVNALRFFPAKSLCRFNGVCRDWKHHISSPFFAHSQSYSFSDPSGFFCQSPDGVPSFISLNPMAYGVRDPSLNFLPEPIDIRCSSNGLLCCQGRSGDPAYYICNPVTQRWKKLPKPTANHGPNPVLMLVFEPSLMNFVADYKLVCAFPSDLDGYEFEIYSSAKGSWSISGEICFGDRRIQPRSGVHVGSTVYWQASNPGIVAFDLKTERTTLQYANASRYSVLGQVNGKLCSASASDTNIVVKKLANAYTNTMGSNMHAKAWEVIKTISLSSMKPDEFVCGDRRVVFIGGDVVVVQFGQKLVSYNMKTNVSTQLDGEVTRKEWLVPYVNSLVEI